MKKITLILLALILACTGCSAEKNDSVDESEKEEIAETMESEVPVYERTGSDFEKWMDKQFKETLEDDYLEQHYDVVDYASFGMKKGKLDWGSVSYAQYEEDLQEINEYLDELNSFDYDSLSEFEKVYYDNLKHTAECVKVMNEHPDLEWYFMPGNPINDNLVTNMLEFVFRSEEDVQDYLVLLADMDRFLLEAVSFTEEQAARGYFMQDNACDETIEMLLAFTDKVDDNALIQEFNTKMDKLEIESVEEYKEQNAKIVKEEIIPAWNEAAERLEALKGTADESQVSYLAYDGGKEYYEALLKYKSSSNYSVEEIWNKLWDYFEVAQEDFFDAYEQDKNAGVYEYISYEYENLEPTEVLQIHEENMYRYVPYGPEVSYTATFLDESVANDSIIAYYVNPPIDAIYDNVIKINPHLAGDDQDTLWTTMAHEGFPGHCYQNTYFLASNPHPIAITYNMIGYGEGWAMHTELYSYEWLGFEHESTAEIAKYDSVITGYVLACLSDIGIQYYGWDVEDMAQFYSEVYGQDIIADQVISSFKYYGYRPGLLIPYGFGMAEMETVQHRAKEALGANYSDIELNTVILNYGERCFERVENDVNNYIISKGGTINE